MSDSLESLSFDSERLVVSEWHRAVERTGLDLARSIVELMTPLTTRSLPESWRGDYSLERAQRWIAERDAESPTLLVTDRQTGEAIGLLIVFLDSSADEDSGGDARLGYLLSDSVWGQGLASELVAGLVGWSKTRAGIATLTAGVEASNVASQRVLLKNGFAQVGAESEGQLTYRLSVDTDPWDEHAAAWDDDPSARSYATAAFSSLVAALAERGVPLDGATVCDFGCGTGLMTEQLVDMVESIDAVDTSAAMLDVLAHKITDHGWQHVRLLGDAPASQESHDLVVCSSVCSFLDDYPGTVQRLADLLRPGGVFVQWDWERDDAEGDAHGLSRREIEQAVASAGLVRVHVDIAFKVEIDGQVMQPLIGVGQKPHNPVHQTAPIAP